MSKPFCTAEDFNYDEIRRSYDGTSMVPDKRAESEIARNIAWLNERAVRYNSLCVNNEQQSYVAEQLPIFKAKYLSHFRDMVAARSRCISILIAGRGNFPVRRAEKANASAMAKMQILDDWAASAAAAIEKGIASRKAADQKRQESIEKIMRMFVFADLTNPLIRQNCYARLRTWARSASDDMVKEALGLLKQRQDAVHGGKGFTPRHKVWTLTGCEGPRPGSDESGEEVNGITVVKNTELDRVQMIFPGKPSPGVISNLKAHGWRWSPKNGAWQRQNTANAYVSAMEIAGM